MKRILAVCIISRTSFAHIRGLEGDYQKKSPQSHNCTCVIVAIRPIGSVKSRVKRPSLVLFHCSNEVLFVRVLFTMFLKASGEP